MNTKMSSEDLFLSLYDYSEKIDPWGTAMISFFDVAEEMYNRNLHILLMGGK